MSIRKYERAIIKHRCIERDGHDKAFHEEWKKYHDAKVKNRTELAEKNGNVTAIRTKPITKKTHHDNGKLWLRQLRTMREMFANMKKQADEKQSENAENASE